MWDGFDNNFELKIKCMEKKIWKKQKLKKTNKTTGKSGGDKDGASSGNIYKRILQNKNKFVKGHCSSGHRGAVKEVLANAEMQKTLGNTKASEQVALLDSFFKMLNNDKSRAIYGLKYIIKTNESSAIEQLLITDTLFRNKNVKIRRQYVDLVESCQKNGAEIVIFSSLHVSGERMFVFFSFHFHFGSVLFALSPFFYSFYWILFDICTHFESNYLAF